MSAEQYLTLNEAAQLTPGRPHVSAVWRWARKGVKVRGSQERIRLSCVRAGARLLTTRPWLDEFMASLAQADMAHFEDAPTVARVPVVTKGERTPEARALAAEAARQRTQANFSGGSRV